MQSEVLTSQCSCVYIFPWLAGKNNGTVNGVQYFKCKDKHGLFVQKDKITVCPSSLLSSPVKKKPSTVSHSQRTNPSLLERGRNQQGAVSPRSTRDLSLASRAEAKKRGPSPTASAGKRTPPLTPTTDFESTSISESTKQTTPTEPPPFAVGESVRLYNYWDNIFSSNSYSGCSKPFVKNIMFKCLCTYTRKRAHIPCCLLILNIKVVESLVSCTFFQHRASIWDICMLGDFTVYSTSQSNCFFQKVNLLQLLPGSHN